MTFKEQLKNFKIQPEDLHETRVQFVKLLTDNDRVFHFDDMPEDVCKRASTNYDRLFNEEECKILTFILSEIYDDELFVLAYPDEFE